MYKNFILGQVTLGKLMFMQNIKAWHNFNQLQHSYFVNKSKA